MTKLFATTCAAAALLFSGTAMAAPWQTINQRQAALDQRIDNGVRNGSLTPREAGQLRVEFRGIAQLEARYRSNGLSVAERQDLDRRFDALSGRIRYERADGQNAGQWQSINQRQRAFDMRIDQGVRNGHLKRNEAYLLRTEFRQIADLEARYRRDGLTAGERRDLDFRLDRLGRDLQAQLNDRDRRRG